MVSQGNSLNQKLEKVSNLDLFFLENRIFEILQKSIILALLSRYVFLNMKKNFLMQCLEFSEDTQRFNFCMILSKWIKIYEKNMIFAFQNGAWAFAVTVKFINPIKNRVFPCLIMHFLTTSENYKHFYFTLNKKYGSFLEFWAPSQLPTTKSRFCGSSQSLQGNGSSNRFDEFWWFSMKMWKSENFARSHRNEIFSYRAGKGLKIPGKIHTFCFE